MLTELRWWLLLVLLGVALLLTATPGGWVGLLAVVVATAYAVVVIALEPPGRDRRPW